MGARPAVGLTRRHRHLAASPALALALLLALGLALCCGCTPLSASAALAHKAGKAAARAARSGVKAGSQGALTAGAAVASATKRGSLRTWEAVRAAAKEEYEHNLVRAGLRKAPAPPQQPEEHAGATAAVTPAPLGLEAAVAQLQGGGEAHAVAQQQQQRRVEVLAEAVPPPPTQPSRDGSRDGSGTTGAPPAAAAGGAPPPSQQSAGFRAAVTTALKLLLTHAAAFLLGWLLRGHATQQQPQSLAGAPQVAVTAATPKPQKQMAAASSTSSSSHVVRKRRQQQQASAAAAAAPAGEQQCSAAAAGAAEDAAADQPLAEEDSYVEMLAEEEDGTCAVSAATAPGGRSSGGVRFAGLASAMRVYKPAAAAGAAAASHGHLRRSTSNASSAGSSPGVTAAPLKQHRPGGGGGSSKQLGIVVHRRPAAHQRRQQQQVQLAQQLRQLQLQQQQHNQQQQQLAPVQVINQAVIHNHNSLVLGSQAMEELVRPVVSVMRELQTSVAAVAHLGSRIMGWSAEKDAAQRLAEQQHLLDRAAHIGQLLGLVLLGVTALRVGRLWEAHQVCQVKVYEVGRFSHLAQRLTGTSSVAASWRYLHCCASQLGLYAAGLFALYLLTRLSWQGAARGSSSSRPSNAWQLDLVVVKACVCSWLGAHVVHCLGGAWVPWLAAWLVWCGLQAALNVRVVGGWASSAVVVAVSLLLPLVMSVAPFHASAVMAQAAAMQAAPWLQRLPTLSLGGVL